MPSTYSGGLSSRDVRDIWRYAVATDFHAIDSSIKTDKRIVEYGTEDRFLSFDDPIGKSRSTWSINCNGQWLAFPDKSNIDIYNLETGEKLLLKGHTSPVRVVQFSPTNPNLLVSFAERDIIHFEDEEESENIIWDIEEQRTAGQSRSPIATDEAAKAGVEAVIGRLGDSLKLSIEDSDEMQHALQAMMGRFDTRNRVPPSSRLNGRISTRFEVPVFSNAGEYLIYLPGSYPESNGDDTWDICLYNLTNHTTTTLSGHRDSIVWIGFSPDDELVASAGWDGFFRVHEVSGKEVWKWATEQQNWTAAFSPDGKFLAGTDGLGIVRIWNLQTGEETAKFDNGPRWSRTIDWSPDGKYIIVASETHGRLRLFTFSDGEIELAQERSLSTAKTDLEVLDPSVRGMVYEMMCVHTAKFLQPSDNTEQSGSMKLVHGVTTDEGIEVFDFYQGKGWRFVPPYNEDGSVAKPEEGNGQSAISGYIWRKETGEIGIIGPDGIRFWRLD